MVTGLAALDELDLTSLDKEGKPPVPSRLTSAAAMRMLYTNLLLDDQGSAIARVRVQAMKDGEPPFNQAKLNASGQGSRANANFLLGQDLITKANNGYNDIVTSVKALMTIEVEGGEPSERMGYSRIIATELTRTLRKWPGFIPNFLRLVDLFVTHGVGIAYFPDSRDFRFEVAGFGEFLIPRGTPAMEDKIPYAIARKDTLATELWDSISNEKVATQLGWNVQATKNAINRATTRTAQGGVGELETLQMQVKNNDLMANRKFAHIPLLHGWVREFDGTWSFFIAEKDSPDGVESDFLFKEYSRFQSVEEAFTFFCYGIGNGTYHSTRGMGNMIFALVQLHNRLMCQKADGEMLANSIIVQAENGTTLQNMSLNYMGPFAMLSAGLEILDRKFPTAGLGNLGYLGEVKNLMGQVSSRFMAPDKQQSQVYKNRDETGFEQEAMAAGDSGAIDLFYNSQDRVIREACRRIIKGPKSDKLVAEFHRRIERAGITQEILDSIDHDSTYAYRALGAGSPAARSLAFIKLLRLMPQLDEIGRKNLLYEFVANEVGFQHADVFASKAEEPRLNGEASLAYLENVVLGMGHDVPVLSYQMHATHEQIHMPPLMQILSGVADGSVDPMGALPGLRAALNHITAHGDQLAQDPSQTALFGQVREAVNNVKNVVDNMERKIKAEQRKAQQEGGDPAAQGQPDTAAELDRLKVAAAELKLQYMQKKGDLELATMQAKADQNLALGDLKGQQSVLKEMNYPQSDFSQRR